MSELFGVTGSTGALGGRVAHHLAELGLSQRLVVRQPERAPDLPRTTVMEATYSDAPGMRRALDGVNTLFIVSGREAIDRLDHHLSAIDAAIQAGVERIVYTSFLGAAPDAIFTLARQHWHTEQKIRGSGMAFTFLRDSLYLDIFPHLPGPGGVIRAPAGQGRFGGVARDDIAAVAAAVLTNEGHDGQTYQLTGPESISITDAAAILGGVTGRTFGYHRETEEEAYRSREIYNAPAFEVEGWVSSYLAIAAGELDVVSGDVETLTGRRPMSLADFLSTHPASYQHLL